MKLFSSQFSSIFSEGEMRQNILALLRYLAFLFAIILTYALIFQLIMVGVEDQSHSWITGIYWTLVTMTTLGFGDITFTTDIGRLFTVFVLVSGLVLLLVMLPFTFIRFFYAPWRKCANLSWKLKRLQTLWFDGIGRNNIKPVRERSRDEESVTFGEKTQEEASTG